MQNDTTTIVANATAPGTAAIAVVRLSGSKATSIADKVFRSVHDKVLSKQKSHTIHLGHIVKGNQTLDEVLVSLFKGPNSYTGEDVVEISCHGSTYIQQQLIQLLLNEGAQLAEPGEFTLRAFINGKMDLTQAEAVADLIASEGEAAHRVAIQQLRGGISNQLEQLREQLVNFASLVELELDFSEEDVDFADREALDKLLHQTQDTIKSLIDSFSVGNAMKQGVPVAIAGKPNAGKSSLLNALAQDEKAIVSEIAGTTRDSIEDTVSIDGIQFRFIDTAGLRETKDTIEAIGVEKARTKISDAQILLYVVDPSTMTVAEISTEVNALQHQNPLVLINKSDLHNVDKLHKQTQELENLDSLLISAETGLGLDKLCQHLVQLVKHTNYDTIVSNSRHHNELQQTLTAILAVREGLANGLTGDLLAVDLRTALHHLGMLTGSISSDELLGNIFANFCIGK
ncbi:MAG: tRNA uridine-5-carboxymethylaminomethyl(34) synthesis GTPase MnmE [Flavobacteriaceae bacterium]|nr:tRNA uridine-5-carboxymethylaminomethyl(34) synthesis GTPase MnmE [Flavobacteriaceae bacterium]